MNSKHANCSLITPTLLALSLFGCSGGGGSGAGPIPEPAPVRASQLALDIVFPLHNSSTHGVPEVIVSGTLVDKLDGELHPGDIVQFEVNGVAPEIDLARGHWIARVPTSTGEQELIASLSDSGGNSSSGNLVFFNTVPRSYRSVHVTEDGQSALVSGGDDLRWLDFATRQEQMLVANIGGAVEGRALVSGPIRLDAAGTSAWLTLAADPPRVLEVNLEDAGIRVAGSFPAAPPRSDLTGFYTPGDFDIEGDRVYYANLVPAHHVVPYYHCAIGYMDTGTGERTELVSEQGVHLPGPACLKPAVIDFPSGRLYGIETPGYEDSRRLNAINLTSGERAIISDETRGTGPDLMARLAMFIVDEGEGLLTLDYSGIFHIDKASGNRRLLLAEPEFPRPYEGGDLDELNGRLITTNGRGVFSLDLASGDIEVLQDSGTGVGDGPHASTFTTTVVDGERNRLLLFDRVKGQLLALDLASLRREEVLANYLPEGITANINYPHQVVMNEAAGTLYYLAGSPNPVFVALDLASGETVVLGPEDGNPELVLHDSGLWCLDSSRDLLYASGWIEDTRESGVISVDLATGERHLVSNDSDFDSFTSEEELVACLHDPATDRLLALSRTGAVLEVSRDDGQRRVLIEGSAIGPWNGSPEDMAWDEVGQQVLLYFHSEISDGQVHTVDLDDGKSSLVATDVATFAYNHERSLIYTLEKRDSPGDARIDVIDRRGGGRATIANPPY